MGSSDHGELKMLSLKKNWHLICCVLWAVISVVAIAENTETNNHETNNHPVAPESAESVLQEDSALLRNFFSVNLHKSQKSLPPPPPAHHLPRQQISHRKLPIVSKHTQKARLRGLFKALRNPMAHAKFMRHKNLRRLHQNQKLASVNEKRRQFEWKQIQQQKKQQQQQQKQDLNQNQPPSQQYRHNPPRRPQQQQPLRENLLRDEKPSQSVRPKPSKRLPPSEGRGFDARLQSSSEGRGFESRPRGSKRPLNRRPPPMLKRLEKEPQPPKRKLEPYKKNVNIRLP